MKDIGGFAMVVALTFENALNWILTEVLATLDSADFKPIMRRNPGPLPVSAPKNTAS